MDKNLMQPIVENIFALMPIFKRTLVKPEIPEVETDMSPSHMHILFLLDDLGTQSMLEISRHLNVAKSNLTPLVQKLIDKGLLERTRGVEDRRMIHIAMTSLGQEFMEEHKRLLAQGLKEKMQFLDEDELKRLSYSLNEVREILSKLK